MKRLWKSYFVFLSKGYKWLALTIFPLMLLGLVLLLFGEDKDGTYVVARAVILSYVPIFELVSDYWLFGGLCNKTENGLVYLKSSVKGMEVLRNGIIGDLLRRFLYQMILGLILFSVTGNLFDILLVFILYAVEVATLNVLRHMVVWQFYLILSAVATLIYDVLFVLIWVANDVLEASTWVLGLELAVAFVIDLLVSVGTVWYMLYCAKKN